MPAIVHLGFDHFSAVLEEVNGHYRVRDPALGGELWMPREALDEEMTGAALIPVSTDAPRWRELSASDAAGIAGHPCPPGLPDSDENQRKGISTSCPNRSSSREEPNVRRLSSAVFASTSAEPWPRTSTLHRS